MMRLVDAATYTVELDGAMLTRGFRLYVWVVTTSDGRQLLHVGRKGDNSTPNAQPPFNRMGQHLGNAENSSMLRNHLMKRHLVPETCNFRLVAHGPILYEAPDEDMEAHKKRSAEVRLL